MLFKSLSVLCCAVLTALISAAVAQVEIEVSRQGPYTSLRSAVGAAGPGDVIRISAGRYAATDLQIPHDLTIIGDGNVVIASPRPVAKGLLVPQRGVSLEVRGLTFEGATSPDENGAGIRVEGNELIVVNCAFRNNENGILATGSDGGEIYIAGSTFSGNGYGDGYSHGIYVSSAARLEIAGSRFEGTKIGHHVKSIASQSTIIRNTVFEDDVGRPSYIIDVTGGGDLVIEDNIMRRAASAEQKTLINYDTSRGGSRGSVTIRNNQVNNRMPGARLLRNPESAPVSLEGNSIENLDGGTLSLPVATPQREQSQGEWLIQGEPSIADIAALDDLSPQQRRSVEQMLEAGESLRVIQPAEQLAREYAVQPARRTAAADTNPQPQTSATILTRPLFPPLSDDGVITVFNLVPADGRRATSAIVTFALPFVAGDLQPDDRLAVRADDRTLPVQLDVKALHRDGSVRHAILTVDTQGLPREATVPAFLVKTGRAEDSSLQPQLAGFNPAVSIEGTHGEDAIFFGDQVNLQDLLETALASSDRWLDGPLAVEVSVREEVGSYLTLRADVRFLADNSVRARLVFENHKTFAAGNRDLIYNVIVRDGSAQIMQRSNVQQYRGSNWSEVIWKGRSPAWQIQYDPAYIFRSLAVPVFDLNYGIDASIIKSNLASLTDSRAVFSPGLLEQYMPTSGGRQDIGLLPAWDIHWLKTQDDDARQVMIAMAERAGSVPWHFEDDATGMPVRVDQRPQFWAEERGTQAERGYDTIPEDYFAGADGGWTLDSAHKPLVSYTAYMVTGDAYYARELAHEAAFAIANIWPDLRDGRPLVIDAIQVRSRAWALRDIANAAWLLPEEAPLKGYFSRAREANINRLFESYVVNGRMDAAGETEGWFAEAPDGGIGRISPWQNDYLIMVLAQEALRGSTLAAEVLVWAANYHAGRFLASDNPALGAAPLHIGMDGTTGEPVSTWAELFERTRNVEGADETYGNSGEGYVASAYAALAGIYSVTGDPEILTALKALAATQTGSRLFDPDHPESVYTEANYLLAIRDTAGRWRSITELMD